MVKIAVLQHAAPEGLGTIADSLKMAGIDYDCIRTFEGEPVPKNMDRLDALIVMGGPQSVYEHPQFPYLKEEMRLIEQAVKAEKPLLGICFGSQLLAAALGAPVTKGKKKEIGWLPIRLKEPTLSDPLWKEVHPVFTGFHWHGDIFGLPKGAISLASSDLTEHQAFRWGKNAYDLLFHMEITRPMIQEWTKVFAGELKKEGLQGDDIERQAEINQPTLQKIGASVYSNWAKLILTLQLTH